jgi:probable F420-dependent oxidoreductase
MTRLGILSVPPSIGEITRLAQDAEDAGFDSVWTGEYFSRNAFTTLTAMALATRRIAVGSGIAYAFLRSPVQLAMAAADVDEVSHGRMNLGLGAGTRAQNENWYGVPFASPGPRLEETVAIARALWSHQGGAFKHTGRFYNLSIPNFVRHRQQRERIPVHLGVASPYMLRLAGRIADGLLGHVTYTRSYYRKVALPALERGAREAGRNTADIDNAISVLTVIDRDRAQARRDAAAWLSFYYVGKVFHGILDFHGWNEEKAAIVSAFRSMSLDRMSAAISDRVWGEVLTLVGTADEVRRQWREISELARNVILLAPAPYGGLSFDRYQDNYREIFALFSDATIRS